jgi:hypothetical protein
MSEETGIASTAGTETPMASVQSRHRHEVRPFRGGVNMIRKSRIFRLVHLIAAFAAAVLAASSVFAQVSPIEISNPKLRTAEQEYLPQLQYLQHTIGETQFPLPFVLTRYVGVDPARQASLDPRGLEFVYFQNRILLKTSGFYTAAFNSDQLSQNQRASRTFQEVVVPILGLVGNQLSLDMKCDGVGFEIAYHVRAANKSSDFEGREILAVVFDRADAVAFVSASGNEQRQAILNRSGIYLDAKPFRLALGQKDPINEETLAAAEAGSAMSPLPATAAGMREPSASPRLTPATSPSASHLATALDLKGANSLPRSAADVDRLQAKYQPQLDALQKENGAQFHLVDYAPPSFTLYHKQLVLQLTFRNPAAFEKSASSIYKRAARTFDLFLAPQLKALVPKLPTDQVEGLDFSVLNNLGNEKDGSEAVEFICPLKSIQSFVEDGITSQELIDQSLVLVNGVRINLHLELVE